MLAGGTYDDSVGYFVRPTLLLGHRPARRDLLQRVLRPDPVACTCTPTTSSPPCSTEVDGASPYALTGSIIARDRVAVAQASRGAAVHRRQLLHQRQAAPARSSASNRSAARGRPGTNDKAGSAANLMRWTSPRSIKETFVAATSVGYPHQLPG